MTSTPADVPGLVASFINLSHADASPESPEAIDAALLATLAAKPTDAVLVAAARVIAEAAKEDTRRDAYPPALMTALATSLERTTLDAADRHQLHRAVGNLLADNEQARQALLDAPNAVQTLIASTTDKDETVAASALSVLANFAVEFEAGQEHLVKKQLVAQMLKSLEKLTELSARQLHLLSVLVQCETGVDELVSHRGVDQMVDMLTKGPPLQNDNLEIILEIIESSVTDNPLVQKRLHARKLAAYLLPLMEDLVNDVLNAGLDVPNSPTAAAAAPPHAHSAALDSCLRILVQLTHDDDIVDTMVQDPSVLGRLSAWLTYPENVLSGPGVDLAVCAALCLGNMARNDANSTLLVQQHRFARHVAHLLEAVKNAKVSMAALSALRHFAMPMENKAVLGQLAVTETVMPSMLSPIPDVSLTAIVIHRQLASEERNMRTIIMSKHQKMNQTALEVALAAILKHSEQNAIKCEVGRLVGVLAKTAARSGAKDMLDALATTAMSPLWHILQLPYAVVWNEAIVALTLLLTQSPKASEVAVPVTFAADVSGVFAASNSLEFRCNAAQLLVIIQSLHPEWKGKFEEVRTKALNELKSSPADTTPEDPERREIAAKYVGLLTHVE